MWGYSLNTLAPDYQAMYNDGDSANYNNMNGFQIYSGRNQSKNGVYGKHGTTQSPPIPYNGKVYVLKGNAIIAFGPNGGGTGLPLATTISAQNSPTPLSSTEVQQRLESEIQKMLAVGHLRPGYHAAGFIDMFGVGNWVDEHEFGEIFDYFQNPSDTVVTLIQTLPYLSPSLQTQVKAYIQTNYGPGTTYDFTRIAHIGFGTGAQREAFDTPPDAYYPTNPYGIGAPYQVSFEPHPQHQLWESGWVWLLAIFSTLQFLCCMEVCRSVQRSSESNSPASIDFQLNEEQGRGFSKQRICSLYFLVRAGHTWCTCTLPVIKDTWSCKDWPAIRRMPTSETGITRP